MNSSLEFKNRKYDLKSKTKSIKTKDCTKSENDISIKK